MGLCFWALQSCNWGNSKDMGKYKNQIQILNRVWGTPTTPVLEGEESSSLGFSHWKPINIFDREKCQLPEHEHSYVVNFTVNFVGTGTLVCTLIYCLLVLYGWAYSSFRQFRLRMPFCRTRRISNEFLSR